MRAYEAWRAYMADMMDEEDIEAMSMDEIGEWAWAEIVAWANNSGEEYETVAEIARWARHTVPEADCLITEDMIAWAEAYAIEHDLDAYWSL